MNSGMTRIWELRLGWDLKMWNRYSAWYKTCDLSKLKSWQIEGMLK